MNKVVAQSARNPPVIYERFFQRPASAQRAHLRRLSGREHIEQSLTGLDRKARRTLYYGRSNKERSDRVQQAYEVSARLREALEKINAPQLWMVLTEDGCVATPFPLSWQRR